MHPFTATPGLTVDMSGKLPVDFFIFFTSEVKKLTYTETVRYAEQNLTSSEAHPKARGHEWIRNPVQREEGDSLLAIIITMGIMGFPTVR